MQQKNKKSHTSHINFSYAWIVLDEWEWSLKTRQKGLKNQPSFEDLSED